eukprot:TRINITY_DN9442_c0_g1_i1.p1 TRINITY_DN9442_c0_g1~~TRINITY_DN9442_c0_g1_i1.p1  ORF type:complete len:505 (+),score=57.80 TRINITY_DN9442_c0_g1_i1:43-1515(+)
MVDTRESELSSSSHENSGPLQGSPASTAFSHEAAAEELRCEQPQLQHLCSVLEENRQLRITMQQVEDDHRVAVEELHRRLRELEEENKQQRVVIENQRRALQTEQRQWWWQHLVARDQHSSQQQATTMEAEPQQLDGGQTVHGSEVNAHQRTGIPEGGVAGSLCASLAEDQEEQPPTKAGSGGGGSNAHAGAVDEGGPEASTAHDAGADDVCSGDECSIESLEVDAGSGSVSHGLVNDSCDAGELNIPTGGAHNDGMDSSNNTYVCNDSGERVTGTCDESSEADGSSDVSSDASDSDDSNNGRPARKRARITSPANGTARRCAATATGAARSRPSRAGDAAVAARAISTGSAKRPHKKRQRTLCQHGRRSYTCKACGGAGMCEHDRRRGRCKDCGGAGICHHGRRRYYCKECGGTGICEHGRQRHCCKDCSGSGLCEHGRQRNRCKECGGAGICKHNRQRYHCKECGGAGICKHGRQRRRCKDCLQHSDT